MGSMLHPNPFGTFRVTIGTALDTDAAIFLLKSPAGIQTPQEPVAGVRRPRPLCRFPGVFDLGTARRVGAAAPTHGIQGRIQDIRIGVEDHRDDFLLPQPQADLETVTLPPVQHRVDHSGLLAG